MKNEQRIGDTWTNPQIPERVQRKRVAGYRHPTNTRYCGRGTIYGNPFVVGEKTEYNGQTFYTQEYVVCLYGQQLGIIARNLNMTEEEFIKPLLKYDYLSCFCSLDEPCHVDVLIERLERLCAPREYLQMELI